MAFVCQQCKSPLHLDTSLVDLEPSAYDMIAASLPPASNGPPLSEAEKLAQLPSPSTVKDAWQRAAQASPPHRTSGGTALSHKAQGKQPLRTSMPNESFVLLQDSMVRNIPASPTRPRKSGAQKARGNAPLHLSDPAPAPVDSAPPDPSPLSHHLRSTQRLFALLASRTELDHPLCAECTHVLLGTLERQLEETKKERDGYIAFEKEVRKEKDREGRGAGPGRAKEDVERKIELLRDEERLAVEQLKQAEREREHLEDEMRALDMEEKVLEEEEAEFWQAHNAQLMAAEQQTSELAAVRAAYAADLATLEKLERTNVYNDAFCIGHDGVFGTINGLRLGRVPGVPVEWAEINAAWGQTLLLIHTIARRLEFTFEHYRLVPMGSFSRIEKTTGDKSSYELYGSGDLHLGRLLQNRRFDFSMVAFLECLKQITDFARSQDASLEFPHQIAKDKIGDVSVKLQFNQEETWTRALRHVLLALKILLKWTTSGNTG